MNSLIVPADKSSRMFPVVSKPVVIPAAGKGSRMLPITAIVPKEGTFVLTKINGHYRNDFLVNHVLNSCIDCGLLDVVIIAGYQKGSLQDIVCMVGPEETRDAEFVVQNQSFGWGLGKAIEAAEKAVKHYAGDDFVVWLGDNIFDNTDSIKDMIYSADDYFAKILVLKTDRPSFYGVVKFDSDFNGSNGLITDIFEKPDVNEREPYAVDGFYYGVAGVYVFSKKIFDYLKRIKPGKGGEFQLTDAIKLGIDCGERVCCYVHDGERYDFGTWVDYNNYQARFWSEVYKNPVLLDKLNEDQMSLMLKLKGGF